METSVPAKPSFIDNLKTYYASHKKLCLGIAGGVLVVLLALFLMLPNPRTTQSPSQMTPSQAPIQGNNPNKETKGQDKFNPLISNDELKRVEEGAKKQYEQAGKVYPTRQENIQFELGPNMKKKSGFNFVQQAYAQTYCNISTLPPTLNAYVLKANLTVKDATALAGKYSLISAPASVPMADGKSFEYYFADAQVSKFMNIAEPSGIFYYHKASGSALPNQDISESQAKSLTDSELTRLGLSDKIVLKSSSFDASTNNFDITYNRDLGLKLVDNLTVAALGSGQSVCSVVESTAMNEVKFIISKQAEVMKTISHTRIMGGTYPLKTQDLIDSLNEYGKNSPIPPIVIGGPVNGPASIDSAMLVYYDYGKFYGQIAYVPVYLTSGKTTSGVRVFGFFPAISKKELDKTPIPNLRQTRDMLQLETFNPRPAANPNAPKPQPKPSPKPGQPQLTSKPSEPGELCYGGLVDYDINCNVGDIGAEICSGYFELSSKTGDLFGACTNGCQVKSEMFDVPAGVNPCAEFLKRHGFPAGKFGNRPINTNKFNGGTVRCQIQGCPC